MGEGVELPTTRCWESGGKAPIVPEEKGYGAGAPSDKRFLQFFNKNNAFLCIFYLK